MVSTEMHVPLSQPAIISDHSISKKLSLFWSSKSNCVAVTCLCLTSQKMAAVPQYLIYLALIVALKTFLQFSLFNH